MIADKNSTFSWFLSNWLLFYFRKSKDNYRTHDMLLHVTYMNMSSAYILQYKGSYFRIVQGISSQKSGALVLSFFPLKVDIPHTGHQFFYTLWVWVSSYQQSNSTNIYGSPPSQPYSSPWCNWKKITPSVWYTRLTNLIALYNFYPILKLN